jgi:hypothetical protein
VTWGVHLLDALDTEGRVKPIRRREVALALAAHATRDGQGRNVGDPVHELITEGRTRGNEERRQRGSPEVPYSSCGDLAHWLLMSLGCLDERLVNRSDDGGTTPWKIGANLSRLASYPAYEHTALGIFPIPGDVLLFNDRAGHVCVLRSWDESTLHAVTEDYGQPYGRRRQRILSHRGNGWLLDGRALDGWLDIDAVPLDGPARLPDGMADALDG